MPAPAVGGLGAGAAILGHVFGQRQQRVEGNLGRATGLNPQTMASLLAMLAPIVMAYLGRQQRQKQLDPGGLAEVLGQQRQRIEQVPQARTGLGALLDRDGDGSVIDDLTDLAGGLFGNKRAVTARVPDPRGSLVSLSFLGKLVHPQSLPPPPSPLPSPPLPDPLLDVLHQGEDRVGQGTHERQAGEGDQADDRVTERSRRR